MFLNKQVFPIDYKIMRPIHILGVPQLKRIKLDQNCNDIKKNLEENKNKLKLREEEIIKNQENIKELKKRIEELKLGSKGLSAFKTNLSTSKITKLEKDKERLNIQIDQLKQEKKN